MIPVKKAIILWNSNHQTRAITKVRVMHKDDQTGATNSAYPSSYGAGDGGWMAGHPLDTPMGAFLKLLVDGFESREAMQKVLYQFREIEGQKDWTSELLARSGDKRIDSLVHREEEERD